jgi:CheY-like chemotaxis protein
MTAPLVLVVRETPSLADSVQLLLETVGFRVAAYDSVGRAFARLRDGDAASVLATVVACNRAACESLRNYPEGLPPAATPIPLIVVGRSVAVPEHPWPTNVRFVALPLQTKEFLAMLDRLAAHVATPATHSPLLVP